MTVSSSTNKVSYSGNGSLTTFAYTFKIFDKGDLTVILRAANGAETVQTITTHYTVTGVGDAGGGNVEFVTAPASGVTVVILRELALEQGLDLVPNDPFPAQSLEESLDKLTFMVQQHEEELSRAIKASKTNVIAGSEFTISAADRANKVFSFDASGDLSVTQELGVWQGDWATSTGFSVRDIVKDTSNNNVYICLTAHTSSGSTPISSNADSAKWALLVDVASATAAQTAAEAAQTAAETAQTAAETAQTAAETAETNAETAQTAAEAAQAAAELAYDNFDDRYLGAKASDPATDNDGNALITGALYFNTTSGMKVYDGSAWDDVKPTAAEQTNIDAVAADATDIGTVATNIANVNTVAGISSNVTTVAGISADVTTVAADGTDIGTVATNISNVNTVAGISANVTTVAGISANVTTVAGISADVTAVAGDAADIGTVATDLAGGNTIGTVAAGIANINTVATDITNVNTVATNLADVQNFANTYRISSSDPATSLDTGDLVFNTTDSKMKVYNGSAWQDVAPVATSITVSQISDLTATAAEINQLDGTADLPGVRPSLLLDFANSKTLDPRITFTRGSTATYWDGKTTAKAEENLQGGSSLFNTTYWLFAQCTFTADYTTAPDGTSTAVRLIEDSSPNYHYLHGQTSNTVSTTSGTTYTWSIYAKKGVGTSAPDIVQLCFRGNTHSTAYANFNISTGTVTGSADVVSSSITSVGNGWYRLVVTATANSSGSGGGGVFSFANNNPSATRLPIYTGDTNADVLLWGPQFEQRSSATAYTATTTSPIVKYQPVLQTAASGEARFDHDPVTGESKGLLIEEARTNLKLNSTTAAATANISVLANTIIAPDGTLSANRIVEDTSTGEHFSDTAVSVTSGTVYTFSAFYKHDPTSSNYAVRHRTALQGLTHAADIDLRDGSVTVNTYTSVTVTDVGNGWYRVAATTTAATGTGTAVFRHQIKQAGTNDLSYAGDGYSGFYVWGAQIEVGSFPTSYIKTSGSTVTRSSDSAYIQGISDWYSHTGGSTVYFEANNLHDYPTGNNFRTLEFFTTTTSSTSIISVLNNVGTGYIEAGANYGTSWTIGLMQRTKPAQNTDYKGAFAWSSTEGAFVVGDQAVATDTGYLLDAPTYLGIGRNYNNSSPINGTIKKLSYYPQRLSNATLQAMTEE
jgi:hypothetical protein